MKSLFFALAALPLAAASPAGDLKVLQPSIPAPPNAAMTASGYVVLKNTATAPDVLLGGSTSLAEALEIHAMSMTGGVMRMRRLDGGLALGPKSTVVLSPAGGYHLMFVKLKRPFKPGDQIPVTLSFKRAGQIKIMFPVKSRPAG